MTLQFTYSGYDIHYIVPGLIQIVKGNIVKTCSRISEAVKIIDAL